MKKNVDESEASRAVNLFEKRSAIYGPDQTIFD